MKRRSSGAGRRSAARGTDDRSLEAALVVSSLLLWLPYSLAAIYVAYCSSLITEAPLSMSGPLPSATGAGGTVPVTTAEDASQAQAFSSPAPSAPPFPTPFPFSDVDVISMGAVVGDEAAMRHRYSSLYHYAFPANFDVAAFMSLLLRVVPFSVLAVAITYFVVQRHNGGEYLMAVAWALGTCSDYGWLTSFTGSVQPAFASGGSARSLLISATPSSWLWLIVSLLTGLFSAILCKVKDVVDCKHDRDTHLFRIFDRSDSAASGGRRALTNARGTSAESRTGESAGTSSRGRRGGAAVRHLQRAIHASNSRHLVSVGDRLYMVVPFCTGQWFAFILRHGWRGIVVENCTILLSLSLVGYTILSIKFLKQQVLRGSGRISQSVAERGRGRRNQHRLQQRRQRQRISSLCYSGEDMSVLSTPSMRDARHAANGERCKDDMSSAGVTPRAVGPPPPSDEDMEDEVADFFDEVGEVAFIDVIDLISKLFTTSFGVVVLVVVGLNIFMTSLCIPFLKALFKLNALVSGVGIVIELIMYEIA
ncbi:hypothetical protein ABL78_5964 [Leptomonas seymouri]|uniref:Uncharacterized protein n=1 Tax=Leptomonas seymouri TaxID=5684 RepID=A0A0N1I2R3_LEPSE|nr:hypothetical protein ABL78_5964 [Leptomonas seymouri]|eukprot:KPI84973.1 hypothetical protein ABL78_5964 [Leptomonas seymouri]